MVLIAFSCGADSVFLLHHTLLSFSPDDILLVYCDHGLRPEEVKEERRFVRKISEETGVSFCIRKLPVRAYVKRHKVSVEAAGRFLRYRMLAHIAKLRGVFTIYTAHHADDVVETVLHHMIRGTVRPPGISEKMSLSSDVIVYRPLLALTKAMILDEIDRLDLSYLHDSSNDDVTFTRNKIRHHIVPIAKEINLHYAQHIREFSLAYKAMYDEIFLSFLPDLEALSFLKHEVVVPFRLMATMSDVKRGMFIHAILSRLNYVLLSDLTKVHIELVMALFDSGNTGQQCSLPHGYIASREYESVRFS